MSDPQPFYPHPPWPVDPDAEPFGTVPEPSPPVPAPEPPTAPKKATT